MVKSNKKRVYVTLRKSTLDLLSNLLDETDLTLSEVVDDLLVKYYLERKG